MRIYNDESAEVLRKRYPAGTRLMCDCMADAMSAMYDGQAGTVRCVDDIGNIHVIWDNGGSLALIPAIDTFHKI